MTHGDKWVRVLEGRFSRPRGSHPGTSFRVRQPERAGFSPCGWLGSQRQGREKAAKKMRVRRQGSHLRKQAFVPQLESCYRIAQEKIATVPVTAGQAPNVIINFLI